ncbi:MAG: sigma-54 dependent transcriptional regulator, partial [Terriglobales bacterium]|jgi:DNA-binding NtrC family response regulator
MTELVNRQGIGQTAKSVLVVDDEPGMRMALRTNFQRAGWDVEVAGGSTEALRKLESRRFPLVVTDVRMPDGDGLQLMRSLQSSSPSTAVIVLTAFGSVPEAVQAMRGGACDYLTKPISFEELESAVERVMRRAVSYSGGQTDGAIPSGAIIGSSANLLRALERARHAARTDADVLIEAESGTGKELFARYICENSDRRDRPFIAVNCAAVPEHLLESELFGHMRGAFTGATASKAGKFELADGGTLLLDEIGEMPLQLQPKLLRALQEREFERLGDTRTTHVNIRIVATTNVSLPGMIEQGKFRADLYYRLNVIPLSLPPLRERREDIPELADFFARKFAREAGRPVPLLHPEFVAGLQAHNWPGNVRELGNFVRRVITLSDSREIGPEYLESELPGVAGSRTKPLVSAALPPPGSSMREVERRLLEATLQSTGGNRTRTAEMLGVSLRTIRNKIREHGLPPRRYA